MKRARGGASASQKLDRPRHGRGEQRDRRGRQSASARAEGDAPSPRSAPRRQPRARRAPALRRAARACAGSASVLSRSCAGAHAARPPGCRSRGSRPARTRHRVQRAGRAASCTSSRRAFRRRRGRPRRRSYEGGAVQPIGSASSTMIPSGLRTWVRAPQSAPRSVTPGGPSPPAHPAWAPPAPRPADRRPASAANRSRGAHGAACS